MFQSRIPLTIARRTTDRILTLPIYDTLELSDVEIICEIITSCQQGKARSLHQDISGEHTVYGPSPAQKNPT